MDKVRSKYSHHEFQFASFTLSGIQFGIDLGGVKEIVRYRCPDRAAPAIPFIEGFIGLRSMSVPVIDLRKRFSLRAKVTKATRIVIVSIEGAVVGLVVDGAADVTKGAKEVKMSACRDEEERPWAGCVEACVETGKESVNIIDLGRLLSADELRALKSPISSLYMKA